ncbi:MAG: NUDIX domain-containing protein [Novosphingobium sp.]
MRLYWRPFRPRTLGVRAVVLDGRDRVVLVRHTYGDFWYLPGGGVKKGESFEAALRRELAEEIALEDVTVERLVGIYHSRREHKDDHIAIFAVRAEGETQRADRNEVQEVGWFSLLDLPADISPATQRRLDEYRMGIVRSGQW